MRRNKKTNRAKEERVDCLMEGKNLNGFEDLEQDGIGLRRNKKLGYFISISCLKDDWLTGDPYRPGNKT